MCKRSTITMVCAVNLPAALKLARAKAWDRYKELRANHGRCSDVATEALIEFNEVNYWVHHFVTNSKANYEQRLIEEYSDTPKPFHSYIRKKKKSRLAVGPLRQPSGQIVEGLQEMAELFADTFAAVYIEDVPAEPAPYQVFNGLMPYAEIFVYKVCSVLQSLDSNSAIRPDLGC